ncbi:class I SAM-dependent methyltransferase [Micromonospora sp. NPDC051925]|uniref:class I SAM-dependent methyltransferase n=1 Tax=Micromonospora sp. NPDC051925 TaxID=3364288 RepID=UPI0037C831A5
MVYEAPATLFAGTEDRYAAYRPPHPAVFVDHIAGLTPDGPILDLGTGPGSLAIGLAELGRAVVGVDVNARMIEVARQRAADLNLSRDLDFRVGDAHDLSSLPKVAGVVIGDALHWFDRAKVLRGLDQLVLPGGFVAIVMSFARQTAKPWWYPLVDRVIYRHLGLARRAGSEELHQEQPGGDHEAVLRGSPFNHVTVLRTDQRLVLSLDELIGLQYTHAYSSPAVLGDRLADFDGDLRRLLLAAEPSGVFSAMTHPGMIIARRGEDS